MATETGPRLGLEYRDTNGFGAAQGGRALGCMQLERRCAQLKEARARAAHRVKVLTRVPSSENWMCVGAAT